MVSRNKTSLPRCSNDFSWCVQGYYKQISLFHSCGTNLTLDFSYTGTKIDLREDRETLNGLVEQGLSPIKREQGQKLANKIRAIKYMECSALTQRGLKQVSSFLEISNLEGCCVVMGVALQAKCYKAVAW